MKTPKVSVLIPSYNYAHYLPEAIESVLAQTYSDFELIIVDNCSTDNTEEIVNNYIEQDNRIKFICNDENIGMYRNYNQALLLASGEYIKFLNADDKFEPTLLEKFVSILESDPTISLVTSYRQYFGSKNDILIPPFQGKVEAVTAILSSLKNGNWIGEPTTVMFRRCNLNLGLFDISLLMFADQDMWLRQLRVGNLYVIDEILSSFRIHTTQGTCELNSNEEKQRFNLLQYAEYRRNAILNNRFGYDLYVEDKKQIKKILSKTTKSINKLLKIKSFSLRDLHYLYSLQFIINFLYIAIMPLMFFTLIEKTNMLRKKIKSFCVSK